MHTEEGEAWKFLVGQQPTFYGRRLLKHYRCSNRFTARETILVGNGIFWYKQDLPSPVRSARHY